MLLNLCVCGRGWWAGGDTGGIFLRAIGFRGSPSAVVGDVTGRILRDKVSGFTGSIITGSAVMGEWVMTLDTGGILRVT